MKMILLKILAAFLSVFLAGGVWLGIILILKNSGIHFLQTVAVYVSHFSFFGWLLFGLLSISFFYVITNYVLKSR